MSSGTESLFMSYLFQLPFLVFWSVSGHNIFAVLLKVGIMCKFILSGELLQILFEVVIFLLLHRKTCCCVHYSFNVAVGHSLQRYIVSDEGLWDFVIYLLIAASEISTHGLNMSIL